MSIYKQFFWDIKIGTGDIGAESRAKIAKAALTLTNHPDILVATFAGGRTDDEAPEIALTLPDTVDGIALTTAVTGALSDVGVTARAVLQQEVRYYTFEQEQLDNIAKFTRVDNLEETHRSIDAIAALSLEAPTEARNLPSGGFGEGFSTTEGRFRALEVARGETIREQVLELSKVFEDLSKETNTNAIVTKMIASGVITIGKAMWSAYAAAGAGGLVSLVSGLVAAVGGAIALSGIIAGVLAGLALLYLIFKE